MDERKYHINLNKADIQGAKYAILPGDPDRVPKIAEFFDNPQKIGQKREYVSYLGCCTGCVMFWFCITGVGCTGCVMFWFCITGVGCIGCVIF